MVHHTGKLQGHYIWSDGSEYFGEFHEALALITLAGSVGYNIPLLAPLARNCRGTCGAMARRPGQRAVPMTASGARKRQQTGRGAVDLNPSAVQDQMWGDGKMSWPSGEAIANDGSKAPVIQTSFGSRSTSAA